MQKKLNRNRSWVLIKQRVRREGERGEEDCANKGRGRGSGHGCVWGASRGTQLPAKVDRTNTREKGSLPSKSEPAQKIKRWGEVSRHPNLLLMAQKPERLKEKKKWREEKKERLKTKPEQACRTWYHTMPSKYVSKYNKGPNAD